MLFDRISDRELPITHEILARMLGVNRSHVSTIAHKMKEEGLIRYSRNAIAITDREGLERKACECYAATARLLECLLR
jgi:CRP-like cAMP-binding protein